MSRNSIVILTVAVCYALLVIALFILPDIGGSFGIFSFLFLYWGWKALDRITPQMFVFMPVVGWLIYFAIKGILALFVGMLIGPYKFGCWLGDRIYEKR